MISFHTTNIFKEDQIYEEANILCFQVNNIFQQKLTQDFKPDILKSCKNCKSILIQGTDVQQIEQKRLTKLNRLI